MKMFHLLTSPFKFDSLTAVTYYTLFPFKRNTLLRILYNLDIIDHGLNKGEYMKGARASHVQAYQEAVQDQKEWMDSCGGTLQGYIVKYGSKTNPEKMYGNGGEAIYDADLAELRRLEERLDYYKEREAQRLNKKARRKTN
jgi:hypothetical protein